MNIHRAIKLMKAGCVVGFMSNSSEWFCYEETYYKYRNGESVIYGPLWWPEDLQQEGWWFVSNVISAQMIKAIDNSIAVRIGLIPHEIRETVYTG